MGSTLAFKPDTIDVVAFGSNKVTGFSKSFNSGISKGFKSPGDKASVDLDKVDNPYRFTPADNSLVSQVKFYDRNSLWSRWRRGYELFTITQSIFSSYGDKRSEYGDYRMYFAYQLFPGVFIPARLFSFPTNNQELKEQLVGIRDANGFNFYNYGLSILAVRYLKDSRNGTYVQSGTTITVTLSDHGFQIADNVYLRFTSGTAVTATLSITSVTTNSFTCTAAAPLSTNGNVSVFLSTTFGDNRWTQTRVRLRSIFPPIPFLIGERLADRVIDRDTGIFSSYSRTASTVSVTCTQPHGLSTGNSIFAVILGGTVQSRNYTVTVTSPTQLQFTTFDSGVTAGSLIVKRLIISYDYSDFVGYTLTDIDSTTSELVFQRADSYGATLKNNTPVTTAPAHRGFEVGRFLTTEMRYQCTCQDYMHKNNYNLFDNNPASRIPVTPITSVKPGDSLNKNNSITPNRDNPGVHSDFGFSATVSGFYDIPDYSDTRDKSYPELYYYQLRWCKHIYAAMFSINHDEGNTPILGEGTYTQSGPNITVSVRDHGLQQNGRIQVNFTSGSAISGEYSVSQVVDKNTFKIVYPFANATNGYCNIANIKRHQFIDAWLLEPNDKPAGDSLDVFYKNFDKENERTKQSADRLKKLTYGMAWSGAVSITGARNQPQQIADYSPRESTMMMSDEIRRVGGLLNRGGELLNKTERMSDMMSKIVNIQPAQILSENFGMLDQPLYNYDESYQYGLLNGGQYLNGLPFGIYNASTTAPNVETEDPDTVTILDCSTYSPSTSQEFVVDSGFYTDQPSTVTPPAPTTDEDYYGDWVLENYSWQMDVRLDWWQT